MWGWEFWDSQFAPCVAVVLPCELFSTNLLYLCLCSCKMRGVNIATSKCTWNFLLVLNTKEHTLLAFYLSIEGNNLIWVLTCKKKQLGLIFRKHLGLVVSVFCFFFPVLHYWNQDLTLMFWGSFSARVTRCSLIKV